MACPATVFAVPQTFPPPPPSVPMTPGGSAMAFETILLEMDERKVATLTVNRPSKLNALSLQVIREIDEAMDTLIHDRSVRGLILRGAGEKAFVAGADIEWMSHIAPIEAAEFARLGHDTFFKIEEAPFPVGAAVMGFALGGGCELAMAADFIVAGKSARFGQPEVKLGLIPGLMGSQRLPRLVGSARARELLFTGRMMDAEEAHRLGLVVKLVPDDQVIAEMDRIFDQVVANARDAIAITKRLINEGHALNKHTAGSLEAGAFGLVFATDDHKEGIRAFLEKRPPRFKGS